MQFLQVASQRFAWSFFRQSDNALTHVPSCFLYYRHAVVTRGYYASSFDTDGAVNGTTICPQGSYCPGGNQTAVTSGRRLAQTISTGIITCPNGQWTQLPGAYTAEQCCELCMAYTPDCRSALWHASAEEYLQHRRACSWQPDPRA